MSDISKRIAELSPERRALLMKRLQQKLKEKGDDHAIRRRPNLSEFPMSFAQERMWFLHQFNPDSPMYNIAAAIHINGSLDQGALEKSLNKIIERHEILRATFAVNENKPVQYIQPELKLTLPVVDLSKLADTERKLQSEQLAKQEGTRPFDLSQGPLLRIKLLRLTDQEYVLLFIMHHIISDGWSTGIFIRELTTFYNGYSRNEMPEVANPPIQYADFADWQRHWLAGQTLDSQLSYWKKQLEGASPILELPTDRPRPGILRYRGKQQPFELSNQLSKGIIELSRQEEVTLFMTLMTAFQVLLYRYTGQDDICVGTPIANRNHHEIEDLIGFFVNTLVIRTNFLPSLRFRELLKHVKHTTLDVYAHQDVPFEMLVENLQSERNMSHTPLFQVMFDVQNASRGELDLSSLKLKIQPIETETAKFDLLLTMVQEKQGLAGILEYDTDLFDASTIERMIHHFQTLLESIVSDPDQQISDLKILSETEQKRIIVDWNKTEVNGRLQQNIHQLFELQAEKNPDAPAAVFKADQLTYKVLNERANQLAHYLEKLGVTLETRVGICVERSLDMIVAIVAILKTGAAYIPLEPSYPEDRLSFILGDANAPILVTQRNLVDKLSRFQGKMVCIDSDWQVIARESNTNLTNQVLPGNLAYIIYTSGSTGQPKGVMIQHRSVINLLNGLENTIYNQYPNSRFNVSLNAPLLFDASVQQLVMLLRGHCLHILPNEIRSDGKALVDYLRLNHVDVLDCVPSQLKILIASGLLNGTNGSPRIVLPGGEAIDEITWQTLSRNERIDFYNMYGPTECTVDSTTAVVKNSNQKPNIGRPLANARTYILDRQLKPVPIGVAGELHIGGLGLARGYLNRPELTAEKFIPDPFSTVTGSRLYKTGDLARFLPDGSIDFLGRIDHQVKVRGFRIELGEIESSLLEYPDVKEAVVLTRTDHLGDKFLAAYIMTSNQHLPSSDQLKQYLRTKLPEYMIPSAFMVLEKFPLTPNGKINYQAFPSPERVRANLERDFKAPQTDLELFLAKFWKEILGIEQIGTYDNFFELGGDSLKAAVLANRLQHDLGDFVRVGDIFIAPTIDQFVQYLNQNYQHLLPDSLKSGVILIAKNAPQQRKLPHRKLSEIKRIPRNGELALSFSQQRMWFMDQLEPDSPLYNISGAVRLHGSLNIDALEKTINEIIHRHEILRTTFSTIEGRAIQIITPNLSIPLKQIDLRHDSQNDREIKAQQLANNQARQPFDLSTLPLLRPVLIQLNDDHFIFLVTMHHIIADGWSIEIFIREIVALYPTFLNGKSQPLPELPIQYVDFAHWQRQWLQGDIWQTQLNYWKQQLSNCPQVLELPTDHPRPSVQTYCGARQSFEISARLVNAIRELSHSTGVTVFMTLLAAFKTFLYRYSGQTDICVGTPIANRTRTEIEPLIGFFVNTLVLRSDLTNNPTFTELLQRVNEIAVAAYDHADIPFETLVDEIQPNRDLSTSPLFQVLFVFQQDVMSKINLPNLTSYPYDVDAGTAKFDLTLVISEQGDDFKGYFEYNADLFELSTISRMMGHFLNLLEDITKNPTQKILDLPVLSASEIKQIIGDWNNTLTDFPDKKCIHELFESQAERTPDTIAVICNQEQLTYRELNQRANQLAHFLGKQGVGAEVPVGICVERSVDLIVGILGILKAGGAYIPLDLIYPKERLQFMIQDAQVHLLITQQHLLENFAQEPMNKICIDTDWEFINQESSDNFKSYVVPDNLAYVIYTSGSTGKPKGVPICHRGVNNFVRSYRNLFHIGTGNRVLQFFSSSFDGSVGDIFMTLLSGATLCIVDQSNLLPGEELSYWIKAQEIDTAILPPSVLSVLPHHGLTKLTNLGSGGESTTWEIVKRWAPDRRYFNLYGPTETTVVASAYLTNEMTRESANIPIGKPIDNVKLYVLNSELQPVPIGVTGELYIGSVGIARGYLNRPDITAQKFIPDPFSDEPGHRLFKTGDLARYLPDGNIEFLGRIDHQLKIRGFRIEPGEIETLLQQHSEIRDAIVMARDDAAGNKRLVAYAVPYNGYDPNIKQIRNYLSQRLPDYMIPSSFIFLDEFPLTPNGKVDRKALPLLDQERPQLNGDLIHPRTEMERNLAEVWQQVLGVKQIGIHDNFFELGGDSILSIQLIARAKQNGINLTPKQLFQYPTIAGLASVANRESAVRAEQELISGAVPLTPIQHWFFKQNFQQPHHWNQAILLTVKEPLNISILKLVIQQLLIHHDALRMRFHKNENDWQQVNSPVESSLIFHEVDLSYLPEENKITVIESTTAELQASLNLTEGPLVQFAYFRWGEGKPDRLFIVVHHLVIDGISWRILVEDLYNAYVQYDRESKIKLAPKTTSFQRWAQKLVAFAQSEVAQKEFGYWQQLNQLFDIKLPLDFPHNQAKNTIASERKIIVSLTREETSALVHEVPLAYGTEINDVLLTALVGVFSNWTGSRQLLIDLEGHGREDIFDDVDLSRTIGWFTALYPVMLNIEGVRTRENAILTVKEQLRKIPHHGIGFGLLRYLNENEASRIQLSSLPLALVSFNYMGRIDQAFPESIPFSLAPESIGPAQNSLGHRTHLIAIEARITRGKLELAWLYSENQFQQRTIEKLANEYLMELIAIINHCRSIEVEKYTPSDFSTVEIKEEEIEDVMMELAEI